MTLDRKRFSVRSTPVACAVASVLSTRGGDAGGSRRQGLEEIVVTAQRRETSLQTTPIAISAYTGEALEEDKIFSVSDLANSVPAFSLTAGTPLDQELNIRGITNTRLDSPTADPSVGTFVDGVYIGRTGDYNFDFYDLERIEIIRGPQGVLLGKNVVGGALSIITAAPEFETSGKALASFGNYASMLVSGSPDRRPHRHPCGPLVVPDAQARRLRRDILHDRDVEDLDSIQARAQLLWKQRLRLANPGHLRLHRGLDERHQRGRSRWRHEVLRDELPATNCTRPWSNLRDYLGITDPRRNVAQSFEYTGRAPHQPAPRT